MTQFQLATARAAQVFAPIFTAMVFVLAACGDDGENGNEDTLLTGFSGFLILVFVVWLIWRAVKKSRNGGA